MIANIKIRKTNYFPSVKNDIIAASDADVPIYDLCFLKDSKPTNKLL